MGGSSGAKTRWILFPRCVWKGGVRSLDSLFLVKQKFASGVCKYVIYGGYSSLLEHHNDILGPRRAFRDTQSLLLPERCGTVVRGDFLRNPAPLWLISAPRPNRRLRNFTSRCIQNIQRKTTLFKTHPG